MSSISFRNKERMSVRLYPIDYGWNQRKQIKLIDGMLYDEEPSFQKLLSQADYVICSNWQTTFNEVLYSDRQCIFLRDLSFLQDEAKPDIEKLHNVGICCYTWEELRDRTEELYERWDEWWNEPQRQAVVSEIKRKYAWYPDNSKELWIQEIERLSRVDGCEK